MKERHFSDKLKDHAFLECPCVQVSEVKSVIRQEMLATGQAMPYSEPEKQVMSRSGDVCVVALTDQWYLNYGEDEWRDATRRAPK